MLAPALRHWSAHPRHLPCWPFQSSGGSKALTTPLIAHSPRRRLRMTAVPTFVLSRRHRSAPRNIVRRAPHVRGRWARRPRKSSLIPCFSTCSSRMAAPDRTVTNTHGQQVAQCYSAQLIPAQPCPDSQPFASFDDTRCMK